MSRISIAAVVSAIVAAGLAPDPSYAQDAAAPSASSESGHATKHHHKPPARQHLAETAPRTTSASTSAQLPNGASSITETYGDWTIACGIENGLKLCTLSQAQGNKETGQRSFAIELRTPSDGKTEGTILMPFGLKLEAGAILKLDDKDLGQGVRFSTCVPQGCLLPVSFPSVATDAMRKGKTLVVAALNLSNGQAVTFNVSLNGFAAALDRTIQLGR
jgi:invasion protein IalB